MEFLYFYFQKMEMNNCYSIATVKSSNGKVIQESTSQSAHPQIQT